MAKTIQEIIDEEIKKYRKPLESSGLILLLHNVAIKYSEEQNNMLKRAYKFLKGYRTYTIIEWDTFVDELEEYLKK